MSRAEQLTAPVAHHGEGRRHVSTVLAALRPRTNGGFVYAVKHGFALDEGPGTPILALPRIWTDPNVRMNEGGCDPDGRFYCGSMAYDLTPGAASLYRLDEDGMVSAVLSGVTISNGLEWDPTGTRAYYVDSATGGIDVLDYHPSTGLTDRRRFASVSAGSPDGLTVDAEGGVWVAIWGGSSVHRYDHDGQLSDIVELPVSQVSACTFGGEQLSTLYITTSREGLSNSDQPAAGALFSVQPGIAGCPVRPFRG